MKQLKQKLVRSSQVLKTFNENLVFEYIMLAGVTFGFLGAFLPLVNVA